MVKKRILIIIVAAVVLLGASGGIYLGLNPAAWQQLQARLGQDEPVAETISASGFIEAEEIDIAPEIGGRIAELAVAEGDQVEPAQVLVRLDDTLIQAQLEVARAGLEVAQARLAQVRAGARPEQIRRAEAGVAQAEAARDGAYQAWQDVLAIIDNPQELNAQIVQAEAQLAEAEASLQQAVALKDAAEIGYNAFESAMADYPPGSRHPFEVISGSVDDVVGQLPPELVEQFPELTPGTYSYDDWELTVNESTMTLYQWVTITYPDDFHSVPNLYWQAWIGVNTAGAAYDGARQALSLLYEMRHNPQQLQTQADAAEAQYYAAEAALALTNAHLEALQSGATDQEITAVEAQVQQAQAELESIEVLLEKLTLTTPVSGQVMEVIGHAGELATPGIPLVTVADLETVRLTVYVPENQLGHVQIGQQVQVQVDSFPGQIFVGHVATIANEAEFIPRNIQTEEERVNMVFAVKVVIPNPDHLLKPGMPADATIVNQ